MEAGGTPIDRGQEISEWRGQEKLRDTLPRFPRRQRCLGPQRT
jgi:hypothetical protein